MSAIPQMPDLTLLHVEQSAYLRTLVRQILARIGLRRMYEASGPAEAFSCIAERHPDLIIMDWNLPLLSGEETLRMIRTPETSPAPRLPIIVTILRPTRADITNAVNAGASEVIAKPFAPKALWDHVQGVVEIPRTYVPSGPIIVPTSRTYDNSAASPFD